MPIALPAHIKGAIFDCDGVIIDSRLANRAYYNKILAHFKLPPMSDAQESFTFMSTVEQALTFLVPEEFQEELRQNKANIVSYAKDIMPMVELNPHFESFARWLLHNNVHCAVHTNRSNGMQYVVDKFDVLQSFSPIITTLNVQPKPHPEGIFKILETWNLTTKDIIFVGDSLNDQHAAAAAGVAFVAYGHEKLDATLNSDNFSTLQHELKPYILA